MQNLPLVVLFVVLLNSFGKCNKEFDCRCVSTNDSTRFIVIEAKHKKAQRVCEEQASADEECSLE